MVHFHVVNNQVIDFFRIDNVADPVHEITAVSGLDRVDQGYLLINDRGRLKRFPTMDNTVAHCSDLRSISNNPISFVNQQIHNPGKPLAMIGNHPVPDFFCVASFRRCNLVGKHTCSFTNLLSQSGR